ncbi:MAG: TonB family protein [Deltaproteobacteria bacterium]|nr:TonB family protein [Deltaproteobacteria bacterium]
MSRTIPQPRARVAQSPWRLSAAQGISLLVHLAVILPLGLTWSPLEGEDEEELPVAVVALSPEAWEENLRTEAERLSDLDRRVEEETRARRRSSREETTVVAGQAEVREALRRGTSERPARRAPEAHQAARLETLEAEAATRASEAAPTLALAESGSTAREDLGTVLPTAEAQVIERPAELAEALQRQPHYSPVAARALPELAPLEETAPAPLPRERIEDLPTFDALAEASGQMQLEETLPPVFVIDEVLPAGDQPRVVLPESLPEPGRAAALARAAALPRRGNPVAARLATYSGATPSTGASAGSEAATEMQLGGGDRIDAEKEGEEDAASTDRNLLYAYLLRVREAVEPLWMPIPIVQAALEGRAELFRSDHIELRVHLRLDGEGAVMAARLIRPSGIPALDRHALEAVARAAPFMPPPERLLDEAGTIGFTYGARTFLSPGGAGGP